MKPRNSKSKKISFYSLSFPANGTLITVNFSDFEVRVDDPSFAFAGDSRWSLPKGIYRMLGRQLSSQVVVGNANDVSHEFTLGSGKICLGGVSFGRFIQRVNDKRLSKRTLDSGDAVIKGILQIHDSFALNCGQAEYLGALDDGSLLVRLVTDLSTSI